MSKSIGINIIKIVSSRVAIQVVMFLTTPIIARLFLPEHFGVVQIFQSIAMPLYVSTGLRYELSIPLGKNQQEASASFVISLGLSVLVTLASLMGVMLGRAPLAAWFRAPELARLLWLLPVCVFISGVTSPLSNWASRTGQFGAIAWSGMASAFSERILTIVWGSVGNASTIGLLISYLIGAIANVLGMFSFLRRALLTDLHNAHLNWLVLRATASKYKKFPLFSTWTVLLNTVSVQLPALMFGLYFSPTIVGYYAFAYKITGLPLDLMGSAMTQVFFPIAAREYHETGTLAPIVKMIFTRLIQIGIFPMATLLLFGVDLFSVVFSPRWAEAGIYAQILAIWGFIAFIHAPLNVFEIINRQEIALFVDIIILVGRFSSLAIGVTIASPRVVLGIFVLVSACSLLGSLIWKLRLSQVSLRWATQILAQYLLIVCLLLLPVKLLSIFLRDFRFILGIIGSMAIGYGIILLKLDQTFGVSMGKILGKFSPPPPTK